MTTTIRIGAIALYMFVPAMLQSAIGQEQQQPQLPQPSEQHKLLQKGAGTWDAEITVFSPLEGEPPMKSKGIEKNELLQGGMWLLTRFEGEIVGMPYHGAGTTGYDPVEKKYVGTWVDSMSPHLLTSKGEYDAAKKILNSTAQGRDVTTGQPYTAKLVTRYPDDDNRAFEMYMVGPDGQQIKTMEIKYKRRAE
jgi:hypothetical protein